LHWLVKLLLVASALTGCVGWHPVPSDGSPAAILVETGERRGLTWYQSFAVSQIDDLPVSHIGTNPGSATVRVAPGLRKLLIRVRFLHRDDPLLGGLIARSGDCPCEALFPIELELRPDQRVEVGGSIDGTRLVTLRITDFSASISFPELKRQAIPIPKSTYIPLPSGGYIPIQTRR
jgi:hypothetical protein